MTKEEAREIKKRYAQTYGGKGCYTPDDPTHEERRAIVELGMHFPSLGIGDYSTIYPDFDHAVEGMVVALMSYDEMYGTPMPPFPPDYSGPPDQDLPATFEGLTVHYVQGELALAAGTD